jgi:hypothetical protein
MSFSLVEKPPLKPYMGELVGNKFKLTVSTGRRKGQLPVIKGQISDDGKGYTIIKIAVRPSVHSIIFGCIWFGGIGAACLFILAGLIFNFGQVKFSPGSGLLFLMFFLVGGIVVASFNHACKTYRNFFTKLLAAKG